MNVQGPSQRTIAERAGVQQSTVSRVLKNDPRISLATAEKVREAAKAVGYLPDPQFSKLMSHMRGMREHRFESVLGFLLPEEPYPDPFTNNMLKGAQVRAQELGYQVDRFPMHIAPSNMRTFNRVLHARGIEGVLLLPRVVNTPPPDLDMAPITVVSVTSFTPPYPVHEVRPDHVHNMELVRQALEQQHAQRPGLISWPDLDRRQQHAGPRMLYQFSLETLHRRPLPRLTWKGTASEIETAFRNWFEKYHPDALIVPNPVIHCAVQEILKAMGRRVPPCYASALYGEGLPGIDQQPEAIGRGAIDMLTAHLQRNEKGWPSVTKHMLIPGRWVNNEHATMHNLV